MDWDKYLWDLEARDTMINIDEIYLSLLHLSKHSKFKFYSLKFEILTNILQQNKKLKLYTILIQKRKNKLKKNKIFCQNCYFLITFY